MYGSVKLLSQTGPFSIPVQCCTQKCEVRLQPDHGRVQFDQVCVGEIAKRYVTLHNTGALTTLYTLTLISGNIVKEISEVESGAVVDIPILSELSDPVGKLTYKSNLSVMTDLIVYGGRGNEGGLNISTETKSKSAGNLSVYVPKPTPEEGVGQEGVVAADKATPMPPPPSQAHNKTGGAKYRA